MCNNSYSKCTTDNLKYKMNFYIFNIFIKQDFNLFQLTNYINYLIINVINFNFILINHY